MRCAACAKDRARQLDAPAKTALVARWFQQGAAEVCARMRSKSPQWWEREPGWVKDDIRRALARPRLTPPPFLVRVVPVCRMSSAQLVAELGRQSARLSNALVGDFAGPRAAEEYTLARRAELGLDVSLDLLEAVA